MHKNDRRNLPLDVQALQEHSHSAKRAADDANRRAIENLSEALDRYTSSRTSVQSVRQQTARTSISEHSQADTFKHAKLLGLLVLAILLQRMFAIDHHIQATSAGFLYAMIDIAAAWLLLRLSSRQ